MNHELKQALTDKLQALADDEMILAHRNSEWCGHGPILEEDIAFSNIALDEMGHAQIWYGLLETLTQSEPDQTIFFRPAADYRNVQMVELPKEDWAFSMLRQYLFDTAEMVQLSHLVHSRYQPVADAAAKLQPEEMYHLRHTHHWIQRLGLGTEESCQRLQSALDSLWAYGQQLFVPLANEGVLVHEGVVVDTAVLHTEWLQITTNHLQDAGLTIPANDIPPTTSRAHHTPHLAELLAEMQQVAHLDPEAQW